MKQTGLALVLFAVVGCASPWAALPKPTVGAKDYPSADVLVLSRSGRLTFLSGTDPSSGYELTVQERALILTPGGRDYGRRAIGLDHTAELLALQARSYAPVAGGGGSGRQPNEVRQMHNRYVMFTGVDDSVLYSDHRVAQFDIPNPQVGRIAEFRYTVRSKQGFGLPRWFFNGEHPVLESSFVAEYPDDWDVKWALHSGTVGVSAEPQRVSKNGMTTLSFVARDLHAIEPVHLGPPLTHLQAFVRLAAAAPREGASGALSWQAVGDAYLRLISDFDVLHPRVLVALSQFARRSGESVVQHTYRFVRDRIRYVAIHEGLGALKPHEPTEVFVKGWGDCKDMTTLLVALLKAQGVSAEPVLVGSQSHGPWLDGAPTMGSFNHAVVRAVDGGQDYYLDATAKHMPFGELPWQIQGQRALVVVSQASRLVSLPTAPSNNNGVVERWKVEGELATAQIVITGLAAVRWRYWLQSPEGSPRLRRAVKHAFLRPMRGAEVRSAKIAPGADPGSVVITLRASCKQLVASADTARVVAVGPFLGKFGETRVPAERSEPVFLGYPKTYRVEVQVALPTGAQVHYVPQGRSLAFAFGTYSLATDRGVGWVRIVQALRLERPQIPAASLPALRELSEQTAADSREAIVVKYRGQS